MAQLMKERMAAEMEDDFVVFLIGMRVNQYLRPDKWVPVFIAMPRMLKELSTTEDSGLLGFRVVMSPPRHFEVIQYWRSFEELRNYARARDSRHFPAWVDFNRRIGSNGSVGIWHETYLVGAGRYETVYNNMPPHGLGQAGSLVPATGRKQSAAGRLGRTTGDDMPFDGDGLGGY